jgi:hypothetical protein
LGYSVFIPPCFIRLASAFAVSDVRHHAAHVDFGSVVISDAGALVLNERPDFVNKLVRAVLLVVRIEEQMIAFQLW